MTKSQDSTEYNFLGREELHRLADALSDDIVQTPSELLMAEVAEDYGDRNTLANDFDCFARTFTASKSVSLGRTGLQRVADALSSDILQTPAELLLAEVEEDYGDREALAEDFDRIISNFKVSYAGASEDQGNSLASAEVCEEAAARLRRRRGWEWLADYLRAPFVALFAWPIRRTAMVATGAMVALFGSSVVYLLVDFGPNAPNVVFLPTRDDDTAAERRMRLITVSRLQEDLEIELRARRVAPVPFSVTYESLKVYLLLGGQKPGGVDNGDLNFIKSWVQQHWGDLSERLTTALLELENGQPLFLVDASIVEESQRTLARLSVAQRAYELLKSQSRSVAPDWLAARKGGPDTAVVFDAVDGIENLRVPGFFTYDGFQKGFLESLGDIADRIRKEQWVLGPAGQQAGVAEQYDRLPNQMLQLYESEFKIAWDNALVKLRFKRLLQDRPQYRALSALSAPTSPLKQMFESIRDETALTKERKPDPKAVKDDPKAPAPKPLPPMVGMQGRAPGANIEAQFKPYQLAAEPGPRPSAIDDIIATLNDIANNLFLSTMTPTQTARANQAMQELVPTLKKSAGRLPEPFAGLVRVAASEFEPSAFIFDTSLIAGNLREQVITTCQQVVNNRYPFVRGSASDVPLADFGRLFGGGGIMDSFFKQNLERFVDTSRSQWVWKTGAPPNLSVETLRQFQLAAWIKNAYMQGGSQPILTLSIQPANVAAGVTAKFESGGSTLQHPAQPSPTSSSPFGGQPSRPQPAASAPPTTIQWPGSFQRTTITVQSENGNPVTVGRDGPWSLFRVLEAGNLQVRGQSATAGFYMGSQELHYTITTNSQLNNPLDIATLRQFKCPTGI